MVTIQLMQREKCNLIVKIVVKPELVPAANDDDDGQQQQLPEARWRSLDNASSWAAAAAADGPEG